MNIRLKIVITIVCFILGIPAITSSTSYVWHAFKFAMQEVNCLEDASEGIMTIDYDSGVNAANDTQNVQSQLKNCVRNLDFNKSSVEFILEQRERHQTP